MTLRLDIVIPTYNRPHLIPPLVKTLAPQLGEGERIIVVWQGSAPASLAGPATQLSLSRPNLPAARNRGIRESRAAIILFLDDDVVPAPDLVARHRACYDDPNVAGVAGFVDDPIFIRERPQPSFIDLSRGDCVQNFSSGQSGKTVSVMGANMSFRRTALEAVGGFDVNYKRNALWEEVDRSLRLLAKGHMLWYCADAQVKHFREDNGGCRGDRNSARYLYHQFANTAYFASRFAKPEDYRQWFSFWKYRLEYFTRGKNGRNLAATGAGIIGAIGGIFRYRRTVFPGSRRINKSERSLLSKTLSELGSKG